MTRGRHGKQTELFLLRIWVDANSPPSAGTSTEPDLWRGKLQKVVNGETREFHDWQSMREALLLMLAWQDEENSSKA